MVNTPDPSTEQRILAAAKQIFMLKGMAGARMQDIADQAGINKALLHYYFRSKEKLFGVIFKEAISSFIPRITAIISDPGTSLFYKLEKFCSEYITMMAQNPYVPLFVINEMHKQPGEFLKKMWGNKKPPVNLLIGQIREDIRLGRIRQIDPYQLLMNIISLCIFPFIGKPMWSFVTGTDEDDFAQLIEKRKKDVPLFIIQALRT
jgi:AcrR family transcriptional regulator